jgi:hypothetical protein
MRRTTESRLNDDKTDFRTSFVANAVLKCSTRLLEATLSELPALQKAAYGSSISYYILEKSMREKERAYVTFGKSSITYTFRFENHGSELRRRSLMMFLSLLVYVKDLYDIDFASIYGYIIEELGAEELIHDSDVNRCAWLEERIAALNAVNVSLAHRLIDKTELYSELSKEILEYTALVEGIAKAVEKSFGVSFEAFLDRLGMDRTLWERATQKQVAQQK